jgi:hypothetical protein
MTDVIKNPHFSANLARLCKEIRRVYGRPLLVHFTYDETAPEDERWLLWIRGETAPTFASDSGIGAVAKAADHYEQIGQAP